MGSILAAFVLASALLAPAGEQHVLHGGKSYPIRAMGHGGAFLLEGAFEFAEGDEATAVSVRPDGSRVTLAVHLGSIEKRPNGLFLHFIYEQF